MATDGRKERTELAIWSGAGRQRRERALETHYQGLWFTLARMRWKSLVLVPADQGESAAGVATALADVGRRLRNTPVTFLVMAGSLDYASAGRFVSAMLGTAREANDEPPSSRVIVAVPPVIVEPLALAVTDAADAVVLYIRRGATHQKAAEKTIDLVGRDRIVGCVLG